MTPADPLWLLAELMASLARAYRAHRRRQTERRTLGPRSLAATRHAGAPRLGLVTASAEATTLPEPLYARVQVALFELGRRRAERRAALAVAAGRPPEDPALAWRVAGREVVVEEDGRALFRALWSAREGGWRLFWSRTPGRWWPYASGTHLALGSFEACVREVERDPHGCFPGTARVAARVAARA